MERGPDRGVASRRLGVAADHEPVAQRALVEDDLFHLEVARHMVVAALPGEGGLRLGRVAPELLADDVVAAGSLEVAAVGRRVEAPVGDPRDPPELPRPQIVLDLSDQFLVGGVAGPGPDPDGDPLAGHGEGARRIEEEEIDLEVERVRHRPVDVLGELGLDLERFDFLGYTSKLTSAVMMSTCTFESAQHRSDRRTMEISAVDRRSDSWSSCILQLKPSTSRAGTAPDARVVSPPGPRVVSPPGPRALRTLGSHCSWPICRDNGSCSER